MRDFTVRGDAASGVFQYALRLNTTANDVLFERITVDVDTDVFYTVGSACARTVFRDCMFRAKYDTVVDGNGTADLDFINCKFIITGPSGGGSGEYAAVARLTGSGVKRFFDCRVVVRDATVQTVGFWNSSGTGRCEVYGGSITAESDSGTVLAFKNDAGFMGVSGDCEYDKSATSGTITEIQRILVSTAGNAQADVKLVKTVDAADAIAAAVDASQTGLDWADDGRLDAILDDAANQGNVLAQVVPVTNTANTVGHYLQVIDAVLGGLTDVSTSNVVIFKNRSNTTIRTITYGSGNGSRTGSTLP